MPKIVILKGLPASGKSTRAKELVEQGYKRINNDDLRDMIDGYKFSKENEKIITEMRKCMIDVFVYSRCNIVIDNTNFNPRCREEVDEILEEMGSSGYEIIEEFIDTPLEECIRRDALRTGRHHVGKKVIQDMYNKYLKVEPIPAQVIPGLRKAIICDNLVFECRKCGHLLYLSDWQEEKKIKKLLKYDCPNCGEEADGHPLWAVGGFGKFKD